MRREPTLWRVTRVFLGFPGSRTPSQRPGNSPALSDLAAVPGRPRSFHVLAQPAGATCSLDSTYCFSLSKEELYPGSTFRMNDALLREYLRQLLESHETPDVTVAWQGGEPTLMGLDFFRRAMAVVAEIERTAALRSC